MSAKFTVSATIPASPQAIYDAWLDGRRHRRMTGTETAKGSSKVGGVFTVHDGYITGKNLALVPGKKIVQAWRTTEFHGDDPDSRLTVAFKAVGGGTKVTLSHSGITRGGRGYKQGWKDYYFAPMKEYFGKGKTPGRAKTPAARRSRRSTP
jgi:uncharacterized protein YndB with AHSA1/START domain